MRAQERNAARLAHGGLEFLHPSRARDPPVVTEKSKVESKPQQQGVHRIPPPSCPPPPPASVSLTDHSSAVQIVQILAYFAEDTADEPFVNRLTMQYQSALGYMHVTGWAGLFTRR